MPFRHCCKRCRHEFRAIAGGVLSGEHDGPDAVDALLLCGDVRVARRHFKRLILRCLEFSRKSARAPVFLRVAEYFGGVWWKEGRELPRTVFVSEDVCKHPAGEQIRDRAEARPSGAGRRWR